MDKKGVTSKPDTRLNPAPVTRQPDRPKAPPQPKKDPQDRTPGKRA